MDSSSINLPEGYSIVDHSTVPQGYSLVQPPSMLESAGRGALNNFPLAKQAASAILPGEYSQNLADLSQKAAISKAVNPVSYGVGATAGAIAPAFLPGVGTALKAAPIAGNTLLGGAQAISDTDLLKNPEQALKQGITGATIGSVLGKILPTGQKAEEGLESLANRKTIQAMGAKPGELGVPGEQIQNMGNLAHQLGLDTGSTEEKFNTARDITQQVGKQIENLGQGKVLTNPTQAIQNLQQHIQDSASVLGEESNPEIKMYTKAVTNLSPGKTFEQLQALKNNYANRAFDTVGNVKDPVAFNIYKEISDSMEGLASDHPEYPELKQAYSQLMTMREGLERQLQNEQARGAQTKGIGMMGRMGGAITGGNVPATLGAAAALAPAHPLWAASLASTIAGNPAAMSTAARKLAPIAGQAVQGGNQALIDYLTSKYGASNANKQ
jgi:hypothetical protein